MLRCVCCDKEDTRRWRGEYYCTTCFTVIKETIREDRQTDRLKVKEETK